MITGRSGRTVRTRRSTSNLRHLALEIQEDDIRPLDLHQPETVATIESADNLVAGIRKNGAKQVDRLELVVDNEDTGKECRPRCRSDMTLSPQRTAPGSVPAAAAPY